MIPLFSKYRMFLTLRNWRNGNFTLCHFSNVLIGILFSNILMICMFVQTWKQSIQTYKNHMFLQARCTFSVTAAHYWLDKIWDLNKYSQFETTGFQSWLISPKLTLPWRRSLWGPYVNSCLGFFITWNIDCVKYTRIPVLTDPYSPT